MNPNEPSIDDLLTHADWLRSLARRLVGDAGAEDLVQDVWLQAVRRPPSRVDSPRGWLAAVLRNAYGRRLGRRSAERDRERETAAREELPGAAELVARAESQRLLVDAVLALDEPYRRAVLLHFFDGTSAAEIARRSGEPASTVRNRIARAVGKMRDELDARGGGREGWVRGVLALSNAKAGPPVLTPPSGLLTLPKVLAAALGALFLVALVRSSATPWFDSVTDKRPTAAAADAIAGAPQSLLRPAESALEPSPGTLLERLPSPDGAGSRPGTRSQVAGGSISDASSELWLALVDDQGEGFTGQGEWLLLRTPAERDLGQGLLEDWDVEVANDLRAAARARGDLIDGGAETVRSSEHATLGLFIRSAGEGALASIELEPGASGDRLATINRAARLVVAVADPEQRGLGATLTLTLTGSGGIRETRHPAVDGRAVVLLGSHLVQEGWARATGSVRASRGMARATAAIEPEDWSQPGGGLRASVELVLDALGSAELRVDRSPDGLNTGAFSAILTPAGISGPRTGSELLREFDGFESNEVSGLLPFNGVPLREPLSIWIRAEGDTVHGPYPVQGPEQPEVVARWSISPPPPTQVLRLRLLDGAGQPLADQPVFASWECAASSRSGVRVTSLDGELGYRGLAATPAERLVTGLEFSCSERDLRWKLEFDPPLGDGAHDLGDLRPVDDELLASGIVVDEDGTPLEGVTVRAQGWPFAEDSEAVRLERLYGEVRASTTDGEGRFELRGSHEGGALVLVGSRDGLITDPVVATRGATDLLLSGREPGWLKVRFDSSRPPPKFVFGPAGRGLEGQTFHASSAELGPGYRDFAVPHGRYDLWVLEPSAKGADPSTGRVVQVVEGVEVPAGGVSDDPRLQPLEVR